MFHVEPVSYQGRRIPVAQCNNVYIFPAIGLGLVASRASRVTDGMILAAARARQRTLGPECGLDATVTAAYVLRSLHLHEPVGTSMTSIISDSSYQPFIAAKPRYAIVRAWESLPRSQSAVESTRPTSPSPSLATILA